MCVKGKYARKTPTKLMWRYRAVEWAAKCLLASNPVDPAMSAKMPLAKIDPRSSRLKIEVREVNVRRRECHPRMTSKPRQPSKPREQASQQPQAATVRRVLEPVRMLATPSTAAAA